MMLAEKVIKVLAQKYAIKLVSDLFRCGLHLPIWPHGLGNVTVSYRIDFTSIPLLNQL